MGGLPPGPGKKPAEGKGGIPALSKPDSATGSNTANQLTPEEQMALFEKELKETDWGHQPC